MLLSRFNALVNILHIGLSGQLGSTLHSLRGSHRALLRASCQSLTVIVFSLQSRLWVLLLTHVITFHLFCKGILLGLGSVHHLTHHGVVQTTEFAGNLAAINPSCDFWFIDDAL